MPNPIFSELARMADGARNALDGLRGEVETMVRQQIERLLAEMELVSRDEFEAAKAMAAKARTEQEALEKRVAELEKALAGTKKGTAKTAKASSAARPKAKTATKTKVGVKSKPQAKRRTPPPPKADAGSKEPSAEE